MMGNKAVAREHMRELAAKMDSETLREYFGTVTATIKDDGNDMARVTVFFERQTMATFHFLFWKDGASAWTAELVNYSFESETCSKGMDAVREFYKDFGWGSLPTRIEISREVINLIIAAACKRVWDSTPTIWITKRDKVASLESAGVVDFVYMRGAGFKPVQMAKAEPGCATFPLVF